MSEHTKAGIIRGERRMNSATAIEHREFTDRIGDAAAEGVAQFPGGVKGAARAANINDRTLENILQKRCAPNGFTLMKLAKIMPSVKAEVRRLTEMELNMDPELEQQLSRLVSLVQKKRGET